MARAAFIRTIIEGYMHISNDNGDRQAQEHAGLLFHAGSWFPDLNS